MVILSRGQFNNSIDYFDREFEDYEEGFGEPGKEHFIGLKNLALITSLKSYELKVEILDVDGIYREAYYDSFAIEKSNDRNYKLVLQNYQDLKSNLSNSFGYHNGRPFAARNGPVSSGCLSFSVGNW